LAQSTHRELALQVRYLKAENEVLRSRLPKYVYVTPTEKRRLVRFARPLGRAIRQLVSIVVSDTILRWIREDNRRGRGARAGCPAQRGRPRTKLGIRRLIVKLARETGWGYTRIMGELKKLEIKPPSRNTVKSILKAHGYDPEPPRGVGSWDEFLKRHAHSLWQCDFLSRRVLSWRGIREAYVLVFLHVGTRQVVVSPPTYRPDVPWAYGQMSDFVGAARGRGLKVARSFHDGDVKFRLSARKLWSRYRIRDRKAPFRAPNTQAYVERFVQTMKQECWDHFFVCGLRHLAVITREYLEHYHTERPHQGIGNEVILPAERARRPRDEDLLLTNVRRRVRLGGLLKHYERRAA
jgi:putative transposase